MPHLKRENIILVGDLPRWSSLLNSYSSFVIFYYVQLSYGIGGMRRISAYIFPMGVCSLLFLSLNCGGGTSDIECSFGERKCIGLNRAKVCTDSLKWRAIDCSGGQICIKGQCVFSDSEDFAPDGGADSFGRDTEPHLPTERTSPPEQAGGGELWSDLNSPERRPDYQSPEKRRDNPAKCREGAIRCMDSKLFLLCSGGKWVPKNCGWGERCQRDRCVYTAVCKMGEKKCSSGKEISVCFDGQWIKSTCPPGYICKGNQCSPGCTEGSTRCNPGKNRVLICRGGSWAVKESCPSGYICSSGKCVLKAFRCNLPRATPQIATKYWIHPKNPYAGQTLTLSIQSSKYPVDKAPPIEIELINRNGKRRSKYYSVVGGKTLYYISIAHLAVGENCVIVRRQSDRNVEVALKVMGRDPGKGIPRGNGVWKIVRNHQWTCSEQPTNGNFLIVKVRDENGRPMKGVTVKIDWTDDTVFPIAPKNENAKRIHPRTMVTDSNGRAEFFYKPTMRGIRSPIDSKPGWLVYQISIAGGASDVATEITTGIWESVRQPNGSVCNYCNRRAVNVYGHWSYTIEFRRDPKAREVCDVPIDHAGQKRCRYYPHAYHEPGQKSCVPVRP